jgi:AcrR family transcriptional regulator
LILDTAERLFHERGVVEVSTVDIAQAAGMSVGRLYYWYPDKDAVVHAVIERAERLVQNFLTDLMVDDPNTATPDLLGRIIGALAGFVRTHPGALAVLQRHPAGPEAAGGSLYRLFVELAASIVSERVPDIPDDERNLVAVTCVRIALTMLDELIRTQPDEAPMVEQELHYVLAAYLYARYPSGDDPIWAGDDHPVQPSRLPRPGSADPAPVYPAYAPVRSTNP